MGEAARAAAGQHQAHGGAALDARQPRHVALQRGADVHVVGHRPARQPGVRALRALQAGGVQQHQDLGRLGQRAAAHQALLLDGVQRRFGLAVGQQQQFVAVAAHAVRPRRGVGVGQQQHEVVARLDLVEQHGDAPVGRGVAALAVRDAGCVQLRVHGGRIHHAHAADGRELARQCVAEAAQVHARTDGQQAQRHGALHGCRAGLQPLDDLARERDGHLRAARQQVLEHVLGQPHQHRVAHGHHRGGARRAGEQADLADDLPAPHVGHAALLAVGIAHVGAQPPADGDVHGLAGLALADQRAAAGHLHPLQVAAQQLQRLGLDAGQEGAQVFGEQFALVGVVGCGGHGAGAGGEAAHSGDGGRGWQWWRRRAS
jgi:hypothetical protein